MTLNTIYKSLIGLLATSFLITSCSGGGSGADTTSGNDEGGNGSLDSSLVLLSILYDGNLDGDADTILTYTYDSNGNEKAVETDYNSDGVADIVTIFSFNSDGYIERLESDFNGDGVIDDIHTITYSDGYNTAITEVDSGGDGIITTVVKATNDKSNHFLSMESDIDVDGVTDNVVTTLYEKNATLDLPKTTSDSWQYNYGTAVKLISIESDFDVDGVIESVIEYTVDPQDRIITETLKGVVDITSHHFYNANGKISTTEHLDSNATVVAITTYVWGKL